MPTLNQEFEAEEEELLTERQAAHVLKISPRTLAAWRGFGKGPVFVKLNGFAVRYPKFELYRYIDSQTVPHQSRECGEREEG